MRLQDSQTSSSAKGCLPGIAKILHKKRTEKEKEKEKEKSIQRLERQIQNAHLTLQHRAFLAGKEWDEVKEDVVAQLRVEFTTDYRNTPSSPYFRDKNDIFGVQNSELVHHTIDEVTRGNPPHKFVPQISNHSRLLAGGRFKASRTDATQIRTRSGHLYELINITTQEQAREIEQQSGAILHQKWHLTTRRLGYRVRFARDLYSGDYVAVKRFRAQMRASFINEVEKHKLVERLKLQKRQMQLLDAAICPTSRFPNKDYLFMPLMNRGDGTAAAKRIAALRSVSTEQAEAKLLWTAKEYAGAVAELHSKNLYHHDIRPENFLHDERPRSKSSPAAGEATEEIIKLSDFETLDTTSLVLDAAEYMCPEMEDTYSLIKGEDYSGEKHDAFSLGRTLLYLKGAMHASEIASNHLCLSDGKLITLKPRVFNYERGTGCYGIKDKEHSLKRYPLNTLDNIIAHLLNENVNDRISAIAAYEALDKLYNKTVSTQAVHPDANRTWKTWVRRAWSFIC